MDVMPVGNAVAEKVSVKPPAPEVKGAFSARLKESAGGEKKKAAAATKDGAAQKGDVPQEKDAEVNEVAVQPGAASVEALPLVPVIAVPVFGAEVKEAVGRAMEKTPVSEKKGVAGAGASVAVQPPTKAGEVAEPAGVGMPVMEKAVASPVVVAAVNGLASHGLTAVSAGKAVKVETAVRAEVVRAPEEARTLVSATNVLEVGVAGGVHGWLRVRAEMGAGGEVSAQVITASAGAAENLHKEMPAMQAYLAIEQVGVSSLVVNAAEKGAGVQDAAMGFEGGQGRHEQADGGTDEHTTPESEVAMRMAGRFQFGFESMAMPMGNGGWLSVRV